MDVGKVRAFLDTGRDYNLGSATGTGYGYGNGCGSGYDSGYGNGYGSGTGNGSATGTGYGYGCGSGSGYGTGCGCGCGCGYGIAEWNGRSVYRIDGVPTLLYHIRGNVAKGAILHDDLTLEPCYIVKGNGLFAHGKTLREAMRDLTDKLFDDMTEDERIAAFVEAHPDYQKPYPNQDLFDWHHRLTGSCEMGRNAFIRDKGLSLEGETTVDEFVRLTQGAYGGAVIRRLPESYEN